MSCNLVAELELTDRTACSSIACLDPSPPRRAYTPLQHIIIFFYPIVLPIGFTDHDIAARLG